MSRDQRRSLTRPAPVKLDAAKLAALEESMAALPVGGRRKREPTPEQVDVMRRWWGRVAISAMARQFGVAENTLRRWAREAGLLR